MPKEPTVFVEKLSTWVYTDLSRYPKLEDIKAHMEKLYPTTYDERRHRHVQHYRIDTLSDGTHRVFAANKLSKGDVESLEDANNT